MSSHYSTLTLRDVTEEDLPLLAELANNRDIWINLRDVFPHPYGLQDAKDWLAHVRESSHLLALTIDVDQHPVGVISLEFKPDVYRKIAEIGYWLGEPAWGKGIATTAVKQLTNYALDHFDVLRIEARVFGWNPASKKVLEKCGYILEGTLHNGVFKDGRVTDEFLYARLKKIYPAYNESEAMVSF